MSVKSVSRYFLKIRSFIIHTNQNTMNKSYLKFLQIFRQMGIGLLVLGGAYALNGIILGNWALAIGGTLLSLYYFLSAFQPLTQEPDWSLVYPELALSQDTDEKIEEELFTGKKDSNE